MLISSKRQISDYSAVAGDVRLQIATTRAMGEPAEPVTAVERQGIDTIRNLVILGSRFGHDPNGNLDVTGSTPEEIDLVEELKGLLPGKLPIIKSPSGEIDLRKWSELAGTVLDQLKAEAKWQSLAPEQREFVEAELEPFLIKLLDVAPKDEEE
jgi:hypothetical protein